MQNILVGLIREIEKRAFLPPQANNWSLEFWGVIKTNILF